MQEVYRILKSDNPLPVIFDSPHSGTHIPDDFGHICTETELHQTADHHVDALFSHVTDYGGSLLKAHISRAYIDLNRAIDDIDPCLLETDWPHSANINPTERSDAGIGLIRRLLKPGQPVYDRPLSEAEIKARIEGYYKPYHAALKGLIDEAHYNFGQVWHINCHSMPSASAKPRRAIGLIGNQPKSADFVLGDRDGTSCAPAFTHAIRDFLIGLGYAVTLNDPFKGVELVSAYSSPDRGRHSLQIEINKALYMDEETGEKNRNYTTLQSDLESLTAFICDHAQGMLVDLAAD